MSPDRCVNIFQTQFTLLTGRLRGYVRVKNFLKNRNVAFVAFAQPTGPGLNMYYLLPFNIDATNCVRRCKKLLKE